MIQSTVSKLNRYNLRNLYNKDLGYWVIPKVRTKLTVKAIIV